MARAPHDRSQLLAAERSRLTLSPHGRLRVGVGYPNSYHVGQSSLAYQWVVELTTRVPDVGVERFFVGDPPSGRTLDRCTPLADLDVLAWSCSFELDAARVLCALDAAGIPRRRRLRRAVHPLVVLGGALATLNPLPLVPAVDVFCLGAAERVWPPLLRAAGELRDRGQLLRWLADQPGYFIPEHHVDAAGRPVLRLQRLEKRGLGRAPSDDVPASAWVTPFTEYRDRALVEISRGCPEKCRYCWISHAEGRLRSYPAESILGRVRQLAELSRRIALVATAVGDHPALPEILDECVGHGLNVSVSSLRIPAMVPGVLGPLAACGARSVTIAPETGSEGLRRSLGKAVSNDSILAAADNARAAGITRIKAYFMLGLPGESDEDLWAIGELVGAIRRRLGSDGGAGAVRVSINPLVPKPYTPLHRVPMLDRRGWRQRQRIVEQALRNAGVRRFDRASYRESLWQGYLARGDVTAFELLELAADGMPLGRLITEHRRAIEAVTLHPRDQEPPWHFITPNR